MTTHTPATAAIQRRLERWELAHLRDLAVRQADELDELRRRLAYAEDCAEHWRQDALQLHADVAELAGAAPGITQDGRLVIVPEPGREVA